jgi:hypothetical protein
MNLTDEQQERVKFREDTAGEIIAACRDMRRRIPGNGR